LLHRTARIYPVYLFTTLAALSVTVILGRPAYAEFSNFDILMNLWMIQSWYGSWQISVNFVSWTVSAEWAVYLLFPAVIWLIRALPVNWIGIMLPVCAYALAGGLAWAGLPGPINKCLFLFCSGAMLFRYWNTFGELGSWVGTAAALSALGIISFEACFSYLGHPLDQQYLSVLAVPIVAWGITWKTHNPLLLVGGRASYSIYLVHGVVHMAVRRCEEIGVLNRVWGLPLFLFLSIGIALATYLWIEQPARRWIVNKLTLSREMQSA
jgi:peptidoglycan/LPS O-acetylase OafA/YrhL